MAIEARFDVTYFWLFVTFIVLVVAAALNDGFLVIWNDCMKSGMICR